MHKKILLAFMAAAGLVTMTAAKAEGESPWLVRARAVNLAFDNKQSDGLPVKVEADDRWIPEVDVSYFFTKNIAAELVLTYPQSIDIKVAGAQAGTIKALPPSLVLQYHFTDLGAFKPYVGAGVNYTIFSKRKNILGGAAEVESSSTGLVGQVGADYILDKHWSINVDVKYVKMSSDVKVLGTKIGKVDLDPYTFGIGVGYRF